LRTILAGAALIAGFAAGGSPVADIVPTRAVYRTIVVYQGQEQDVGNRSVTVGSVEIEGVPAWRVVTELRIEGQVTGDTVEFRRADLRPLGRRAKFGEAELTLIVDKDFARGLLLVSTNLVPLNVPLGKTPFLNYYALRTALAAWHLDSAWRSQVSILELNDEPQFLPLTLSVVGEERVTVPAGAYDCWVVAAAGSAGRLEVRERYWVSKEGGFVVRTDEVFGDQGAHLQLQLAELHRP
jgi:hypothetical protein